MVDAVHAKFDSAFSTAALLAGLDLNENMHLCDMQDDTLKNSNQSDSPNALCSTKQHVLALCGELLAEYSADDFQKQLLELAAPSPSDAQVAGRMELALRVQCRVLPKFGFLVTAAGVEAMRDTICPFLSDWMVKRLVDDIDKKLGLPADSTVNAALGAASEAPGASAILAATMQEVAEDLMERETCASDGSWKMTEDLSDQCDSWEDESSDESPPQGRESRELDADPDELMLMRKLLEIPPSSETSVGKKTRLLSRQQVLNLCHELLAGFSEEAFQESLQAVFDRGKNVGPKRMAIALTVQSKVLPKYGFPGSTEGVLKMLDAVAPFASDWSIGDFINRIDERLGLPSGTTWASLGR